MCYVLGGFVALWMRSTKKIIASMGVLMILHWLILYLIGDSSAELVNGASGAFSLAGQGADDIDIAIFGTDHIYKGFGIPFDPEGLLGSLSGACTVLLGFLLGNMIRTNSNKMEVVAKLYTIGLICIGAGLVWSICYPIIKALWTGSYVLYAGGWAAIMLAFFIYFIDIKGKEKIFTPFKALGMNALALYVLSAVLMVINWRYIGWDYTAVFGSTKFLSLLFALLYMLLHLVIAVIMYKKKIFIKL